MPINDTYIYEGQFFHNEKIACEKRGLTGEKEMLFSHMCAFIEGKDILLVFRFHCHLILLIRLLILVNKHFHTLTKVADAKGPAVYSKDGMEERWTILGVIVPTSGSRGGRPLQRAHWIGPFTWGVPNRKVYRGSSPACACVRMEHAEAIRARTATKWHCDRIDSGVGMSSTDQFKPGQCGNIIRTSTHTYTHINTSTHTLSPSVFLSHTQTHTRIMILPYSSQNSNWDCYGSFDEQRLFSVKFARFRNSFDFAQIWGIL